MPATKVVGRATAVGGKLDKLRRALEPALRGVRRRPSRSKAELSNQRQSIGALDAP